MSQWEVRVTWKAAPGVTCAPTALHSVEDETQVLDAAVSVADGARHPWLPVRADRVEIRETGGTWRTIAAGHIRSYL